jgi:5'-3' exoribonuclease 2
MMVEVFKYTERVVAMVRPRKLLFMAIGMCTPLFNGVLSQMCCFSDGVAPRAKMNQQRSRRFRSAQEAKDKEAARKESVAMWEGSSPHQHLPCLPKSNTLPAMGKTISDEDKNKESWDSNAITPGTPFMDLLASSLRYWVVQKMNNDPGWKEVHVVVSISPHCLLNRHTDSSHHFRL